MMEKIIQANSDNNLKYFGDIEKPMKTEKKKDVNDETDITESAEDTSPLQYFTE